MLLRNPSHHGPKKTQDRIYFQSKPTANTMNTLFFKKMDEKFLLEIQSYLLPSESEVCVMLCRGVCMRFNELTYELTLGYPLIIIVRNAARFWKDLDMDFQMKNRDRWDDLARKFFALERK